MGSVRIAKSGSMVGLDIGADMIKVAEAKAGRDGIIVTGLGIAPTPPGGFENGGVADPQLIGRVVKDLLAESGIRSKRVACSVSGQSAMPSLVIRIISVPNVSPEELKETMKWEVEKHVPFAPSEVVMDFHKIERPGQDINAQTVDVLLAVAQQDMVNNQISAIYASGLKPAAIDIHPLAASRALIDIGPNGSAPMTVAILDIGATVAELSMFEGGILGFPSPPIQIAGTNFTQAIAAALGITEEEAERLKKEQVRIDPAQMAAFGGTSAEMTFAAEGQPPPTVDLGEAALNLQPGESRDTVDGPVFDLGNEETPQPERPRYDLSAMPEQDEGPRTYDLGGRHFEALKPVFDLSEEESEVEAVPTKEPAPAPLPLAAQTGGDIGARIAQAIAPVLQDLVGQIHLNLDYYHSRYNNQVEQIYLCGGTALMPGLSNYLSNELGVRVTIADPLANVTVSSKKYSEQYLKEISPIFSVSLGLAIRDLIIEG